MIRLLGFRRVAILAVLAGVIVVALLAYLTVLQPMLDDAQQQLATVDGQVSQLRNKLTTAQQDVAFVTENLEKYQAISEKGLFHTQDRFMADRLLQELREKSGMEPFNFRISDMTDIPSADAQAMGYRLVSSRVSIDRATATLDTSFYTFVQELTSSFPGYVAVRDLKLRRQVAYDARALKDIADGKTVNFINGDIIFDWMTLTPVASGADDASGRL